jgi:hypothetical protein
VPVISQMSHPAQSIGAAGELVFVVAKSASLTPLVSHRCFLHCRRGVLRSLAGAPARRVVGVVQLFQYRALRVFVRDASQPIGVVRRIFLRNARLPRIAPRQGRPGQAAIRVVGVTRGIRPPTRAFYRAAGHVNCLHGLRCPFDGLFHDDLLKNPMKRTFWDIVFSRTAYNH